MKIKKISVFFTALVFIAFSLLSGCGDNSAPVPNKPGGLQPGDKAYDFSLLDSTGHPVKLADLQPGWCLVLILYRGHWCSACQGQLEGLKEDYPKFTALHSTIAAVSVDSMEDSSDFNQQWRFPFPLLSDPQLKVIDAYGARHVNGHEGKDISKPCTIIIDSNKLIRFKYLGKDPTDRPTDNEILFAIQQIQQLNAASNKS
jgi:peroxiredoxin